MKKEEVLSLIALLENSKNSIENSIKELRKTIEVTNDVDEKPTKTKEEVFLKIIKDLSFNKKTKLWSKKGKNYFEQDSKNGDLWCSYGLVWSIFESAFGMKYEQIQGFVKDMVDEHLKIKGLTPQGTRHYIADLGG